MPRGRIFPAGIYPALRRGQRRQSGPQHVERRRPRGAELAAAGHRERQYAAPVGAERPDGGVHGIGAPRAGEGAGEIRDRLDRRWPARRDILSRANCAPADGTETMTRRRGDALGIASTAKGVVSEGCGDQGCPPAPSDTAARRLPGLRRAARGEAPPERPASTVKPPDSQRDAARPGSALRLGRTQRGRRAARCRAAPWAPRLTLEHLKCPGRRRCPNRGAG